MKNQNSTKQIKKKKKLIRPIILLISLLLLIISSIYTLKTVILFKNIETPLRICASLIIIDLGILLSLLNYKFYFKRIKTVFNILCIITLIYVTGITFVSAKVNDLYSSLSNLSENGNQELSSTSLIVKKDSNLKNINDVKNKKIGIIDEPGNIEGYELPQIIIKEEKIKSSNIVKYSDYFSMIDDLLSNKIDAIFLPTSYTIMFSNTEDYDNLDETTKVIYTKEDSFKIEEKYEEVDITKPFTIMVLGVDTVGNGLTSAFNGDALMLITFNPDTLNTTILSIPRDTYMPIACMNNKKNKITNAGWYGEDCIMDSVENYFNINIDYYFKVNFKAVVDLVDAIGGVEVEVPYSFCEQNSKRQWGKNTIFVDKGKQLLNGEQALAFARHRKVTSYMVNYCGSKYVENGNYWNDYVRGQNQQLVIKAILEKLATKATDFSVIENLLNILGENAKTNMNTNTILSLYNLGKAIIAKSSDPSASLNMQRLYLSTYDDRVYWNGCGNSGGVWVTAVYKDSYNAVVNAMNINLNKKQPTLQKEFSFSIKNKYEETIIGKGLTSEVDLRLMPSLIGQTEEYAKTFGYNNGITINVNYVEGTYGQINGTIIGQNIPVRTDLDYVNSITIDVITVPEIPEPIIPEIMPEEPTNPEIIPET